MAEATRSLAVRAGCFDRRNDNLTGPTRFKPAAVAVGESVRTLVVLAAYRNDATTIISGLSRKSAAGMAAIVHLLLTLLASLSRQELAQQVTYLKAENAILRSKLPDRTTLNNLEGRRLVRHGKKLGPRIKDLISIVSYSTFRRWIRNMEDRPAKRPKSKVDDKPGRPRIDESIADTIIRIRDPERDRLGLHQDRPGNVAAWPSNLALNGLRTFWSKQGLVPIRAIIPILGLISASILMTGK